MEQAKQNITALINELDASQDEVHKASASRRLLIETFKAMILIDPEPPTFDELDVLKEMIVRWHGKDSLEICFSINKYSEQVRAQALEVVELLSH